MAFLEIIDLHKKFGNTHVLKGVNLAVDKGGFLVLLGPSGCGKSTLLNTIAGLEHVSSGDIIIDGRNVNALHPSARDIAMVFQSYALYPNMSVAENLAFGLEMRGVDKKIRADAVETVAATLQISHLLKRKPGQLSGGQRQRVAMGRALVRDPQVFLFDEPLSNLDAKLRVDMRTEIKKLHQNLNTTIVYVTHDQIEAMTLATQIAVLKDGEVQQVGTPDDVYGQPNNVFVANFMGSPAMNMFNATVETSNNQINLNVADTTIGVPPRLAMPLKIHHDQHNQRDIILGLRPEHITSIDNVDRDATHVEHISSVVELVEPTGSDKFLVANVCGQQTTARLRTSEHAQPGERIDLAFNMGQAHLFDPRTSARIG